VQSCSRTQLLYLIVTNQDAKRSPNDKVPNKQKCEIRFQYIFGFINLSSSSSNKASILTPGIFFFFLASKSWKVRPQVLSETGITVTGER